MTGCWGALCCTGRQEQEQLKVCVSDNVYVMSEFRLMSIILEYFGNRYSDWYTVQYRGGARSPDNSLSIRGDRS